MLQRTALLLARAVCIIIISSSRLGQPVLACFVVGEFQFQPHHPSHPARLRTPRYGMRCDSLCADRCLVTLRCDPLRRAAMGSHIHAVAAAGTSAVEDLASELDEDCSWLQAQQQQQQQPAPQQQQLPQPATQQQEQEQGHDAAHASWQLPPPSVSRKAWAHATPIMLQVWAGWLNCVTSWQLCFFHRNGARQSC